MRLAFHVAIGGAFLQQRLAQELLAAQRSFEDRLTSRVLFFRVYTDSRIASFPFALCDVARRAVIEAGVGGRRASNS